MSIATVFAHVCCSDLRLSAPWYEKLFGRRPIRQPSSTQVEFQFSDSAEVQLIQASENAGHTHLTLGVLPMQPERQRLIDAGLEPGPIEETRGYFVMCILDPDGNRITFASARRS
ncbi:hypothetical protein SAMN05216570_2993 [Dyella sp. OK004]|uniref:VOC family protein n=1 Tax=Dyella sp. OK004 TaxID=1855292 RepID=UPI0008EDDFBA|nr:VOC family protein [Dyella sp. OK004]SFS14009.1 hypothetical protein SAMN05216570_2993 [Dyella sp. OK004]